MGRIDRWDRPGGLWVVGKKKRKVNNIVLIVYYCYCCFLPIARSRIDDLQAHRKHVPLETRKSRCLSGATGGGRQWTGGQRLLQSSPGGFGSATHTGSYS